MHLGDDHKKNLEIDEWNRGLLSHLVMYGSGEDCSVELVGVFFEDVWCEVADGCVVWARYVGEPVG